MATWINVGVMSLRSAKQLFDSKDFRGCVNRAYYAAYQVATSISIAHGDAMNYPEGRNNPSHEQLPGLILRNGGINEFHRKRIAKDLRFLRQARTTADYRPGQTVDERTARDSLRVASAVFQGLEIENADKGNSS